jgi:Tfp pilus assembly protein PilO
MKIKKPAFLDKIKTRPLTNSEKVLLTLLAIVGIAWLGNQFILTPQDSKIEALQVEKYELEAKIQDMNDTLRKEADIKKEWEMLNRERIQILSYYFPTLDQAQIIYLLNDLLPEDQVDIVDLNFTRPSSESISEMDVFSMEMSIPFSGSYEGIVNMVRAVESSPRRLMVSSLSLDRNSDNMLGGNMNLKVYSLEGLADADSEIIAIQTAENTDQGSLFSSFAGFGGANGEVQYDSEGKPITGTGTSGDGTGEPGTSDAPPEIKGDILYSFETRNYDFISSNSLVKGAVSPSTISMAGRFSARMEYNIIGLEEQNTASINIASEDIVLKYPPTHLNMWVHSFSYAPGKIGVKYITQSGEEQGMDVSVGVSWLGWSQLEIPLPGDINEYPIKITHIYYELPEGRDDFGVLIFDKIEAFYPHHFEDSMEDEKTPEYLFYEVTAGDSVSTISQEIYGTMSYKNEIMENNDIKAGEVLPVGKVLVLVDR